MFDLRRMKLKVFRTINWIWREHRIILLTVITFIILISARFHNFLLQRTVDKNTNFQIKRKPVVLKEVVPKAVSKELLQELSNIIKKHADYNKTTELMNILKEAEKISRDIRLSESTSLKNTVNPQKASFNAIFRESVKLLGLLKQLKALKRMHVVKSERKRNFRAKNRYKNA